MSKGVTFNLSITPLLTRRLLHSRPCRCFYGLTVTVAISEYCETGPKRFSILTLTSSISGTPGVVGTMVTLAGEELYNDPTGSHTDEPRRLMLTSKPVKCRTGQLILMA